MPLALSNQKLIVSLLVLTVGFVALVAVVSPHSAGSFSKVDWRGYPGPELSKTNIEVSEIAFKFIPYAEALHTSDLPEIGAAYEFSKLEPLVNPHQRIDREPDHRDLGIYYYNDDSVFGADYRARRLVNREKTCIDPQCHWRAYFGNLHAHTGESDGEGSPEEALKMAREVAKLDFMAVTDHAESLSVFGSKSEWQELAKTVESQTDEAFVGIRGFEYSMPLVGHYIVLNTDEYISSLGDFSSDNFYDWISQPGNRDSLVFFAHPGYHQYANAVEFGRYQLVPSVIPNLVGIDVLHKNDYERAFHGYDGKTPFIDDAIQHGWYLGALASQDNHKPNWGIQESGRVALLLPKLTREEIFLALRQRRFYATQVEGLQFSIDMQKSDGTWAPMGSVTARDELQNPIPVKVHFFDPSGYEAPRLLQVFVGGSLKKTFETTEPFYDVAKYQAQQRKLNKGKETFVKVAGDDDPFPEISSTPIAGEFNFTMNLPEAISGPMHFYVRLFQGKADHLTQSSPIYIVPDSNNVPEF